MKTNNEIEQIANDILNKFLKRGGTYKIFDEIMLAENIKFKEVNSTNFNFIGALTKGNNGQVYIMVNSNIDNFGRRNFTIAHELGHYFLSHHLTQNAFYCAEEMILEEGLWNNPIEQEANYFASCVGAKVAIELFAQKVVGKDIAAACCCVICQYNYFFGAVACAFKHNTWTIVFLVLTHVEVAK